ncbi:MAG: hypothetical protein RIR79_1008 [Pseudomonadota bacterium]|jgi:ABC-type branched-subunit amino acid transport system substrate-binding protein
MRLTKKIFAAITLTLASCWVMAENGITSKEIVIGQFAAITGSTSQLGLRMQAGMQAYFDFVNEQGGVHGRQIRLITRDDGYEPDKAIAAVKKLIYEDNVFALAGSVGTPTGLVALPILTEAQVPLIGMFTGARALREPFNRYVFHVRASYYDEAERIVQHLTTLGIRKIAIFYQNDSYGNAGLEAVEHALTKRNIKPVSLTTVERNSVDVTQALDALLSTNPDAVIQISTYKSSAALIKRARARNFPGQFFNVSFVGSHALAEELGKMGHGVVVSQVVPFPMSQGIPVVQEYQRHMRLARQKDFDFTSMEGYLTARVLVEGLQYAGKNPTREGLINALESFKMVNFGGFAISYSNKDHMGSTFTDLSIISRGGNKFMH